MTAIDTSSVLHQHDVIEDEAGERTIFGFWVYLMSDLVLFGGLFICYAVLRTHHVDGPTEAEIFHLPFVLGETFLLLTSSATFGFAMLAFHKRDRAWMQLWLIVTFILGFCFVAMELYEFSDLVGQGYGPSRSAFLSAFFTLVGVHGIHVSIGLLWLAVMLIHLKRGGFTSGNKVRLTCLSLFWHFLDIIWICVFTFVYLMGKLPL